MENELRLSYGDDYVLYQKKDDLGFFITKLEYSTSIGEELISFLENDSLDSPYDIFENQNIEEIRNYFRDDLKFYLSEDLQFYKLDGSQDIKPLPIELLKHADYFKEEYNVKFEVIGNSKKGYSIHQVYIVDNIFKALQLELIKTIEKGVYFKACSNCGKLFIPSTKSDNIIYCDRIFKNNRTCKEVGYERKLTDDSYRGIYRKWYKNYNAQTSRKKKNTFNDEKKEILSNKFKKWVRDANSILNDVENGYIEIELDDFESDLKELWIDKKED